MSYFTLILITYLLGALALHALIYLHFETKHAPNCSLLVNNSFIKIKQYNL